MLKSNNERKRIMRVVIEAAGEGEKMTERAREIAEKHWEYVESIIREEWAAWAEVADTSRVDAHCRLIGHHFRTAMVHGYKHGMEDARAGKE